MSGRPAVPEFIRPVSELVRAAPGIFRPVSELMGRSRLFRALMVSGASLALVASGMGLEHVIEQRTPAVGAVSAVADPQAGDLSARSSTEAEPGAAAPAAPALSIPGATPPPLAASDDTPAAAIAVHIPRLNLNKKLIDLHVLPDRSLSVPQNPDDVGWWSEGPRPGGEGANLIGGHVDSKAGPAVFARLKDLVPGDLVTVDRADQTSAVFQVVGKASYPRDAFPDDVVYRVSGKPSLHLVTCDAFDAAVGHNTANLVVFADLVSSGPTAVSR